MADGLNGLSRIEVGASPFSCASIKFSRSKPGEPDICERKSGGKRAVLISVRKDTKPKFVMDAVSAIVHNLSLQLVKQ